MVPRLVRSDPNGDGEDGRRIAGHGPSRKEGTDPIRTEIHAKGSA